ncbi:MAG: hypothetical protein JXO22_03360, partial [Phycisphaerae bacterium]|nr:hypothetical protein [Phycisphaerae bacterium]
MKQMTTRFLLAAILCAAPALGQALVIDGSADDVMYGYSLVTQDTQTGFGDASLGRPDVCSGSELDEAYAVVYDGWLYMVLAGNLETNANKLEIFLDTIPGQGQNQLLATNPDVDFNGLNRMGPGPQGPGLIFQTGFAPDYYITINVQGDPVDLYMTYAELYVDPNNPGAGYYLGRGAATCETNNGALLEADPNNPFIAYCTVDNSNVYGVTGGNGVDYGGGVYTGVEFAIPLSAIGNPTGDFTVTAFINGVNHDWLSNQFLGGFDGSANLEEPRVVDLSETDHYPFTVYGASAPVGQCCVGTSCSIETQADCTGMGGTWGGANSNCDGAPCDPGTPSGRCCIDDGYSGLCEVTTLAECNTLGGTWTEGEDCTGCPCLLEPTGACCDGMGNCSLQREADCVPDPNDPNNPNTYLGDYTNCNDNPCALGACCIEGVCYQMREEECAASQGRYFGDGTPCTEGICDTGTCCIFDQCFMLDETTCLEAGGTFDAEGIACELSTCGTPDGLLVIDGAKDAEYGDPIVVQDTQTNFGDNLSELDAAYAYFAGDRLHLFIAGNLETNYNKLELFFDTLPGEGQNRLLNGVNPTVDFDALGRMGDDGSGNGLTFDPNFAADYWMAIAAGGSPVEMYTNYARLGDPNDPNQAVGYYMGRGRFSDLTNGGLIEPMPGSIQPLPFVLLATVDNSNTEGVIGGIARVDADPNDGENPAEVMTGYEFSIPLSAIGDPDPQVGFMICAFVNGGGHDFVSNQVLGGLGGSDNLADPRGVNFGNYPGEQYFLVMASQGPAYKCGDADGDGSTDVFDIDAFVYAITHNEA